jgi:hypothetical protein
LITIKDEKKSKAYGRSELAHILAAPIPCHAPRSIGSTFKDALTYGATADQATYRTS